MLKPICLALALITAPLAADTQAEKAEVEQTVDSFVKAWNTHNPEAMSALWLKDGDIIDPWGAVGNDRDGVKAVFVADQKGRFKTSKMAQKVVKIRFVKPDVAFVDVEATLTGAVGEDGKTLPPIEHHVVYLAIKNGSEWKFAAARPYTMEKKVGN